MKLLTIASLVFITLTGGTQAIAETGITRQQVKAELAEAIRTGNILAPGDSGYKLNELYPDKYPAALKLDQTTRIQVKAELAEAVRTGAISSSQDDMSNSKRNEVRPDLYPPVDKGQAKTRAQVKAELVEAIRTGAVVTQGDSGVFLNELYPHRYR